MFRRSNPQGEHISKTFGTKLRLQLIIFERKNTLTKF